MTSPFALQPLNGPNDGHMRHPNERARSVARASPVEDINSAIAST